jgi:hypothetical protein
MKKCDFDSTRITVLSIIIWIRSCLISSIFNINSKIQTEAVQQSKVDEIFNLAYAWYEPLVENTKKMAPSINTLTEPILYCANT